MICWGASTRQRSSWSTRVPATPSAVAPSAMLGENPQNMIADWLADRLEGKPMVSEKAYVDSIGRVTTEPY